MLSKLINKTRDQYRALKRTLELFAIKHRRQCATFWAWSTIAVLVIGSASVGYYIAHFTYSAQLASAEKRCAAELERRSKTYGAIDKLNEATNKVDNATEKSLEAAEKIEAGKPDGKK